MFLRLSETLIKRRWLAILLTMLFVAMPYLGWFSGIIIGLVTLNKSRLEGFVTMLFAVIPVAILSHYMPFSIPYWVGAVYGIFLVWLLAVALRTRFAWSGVLYAAALAGLFGVLVFHLSLGDVHSWWTTHLNQVLRDYESQMKLSPSDAAQMLQLRGQLNSFGYVATGFMISVFSLAAIMQLMIARGASLQLAKLDGVMAEASQARLSWIATVIAAACVALAFTQHAFFVDALPIVVVPFFLAGIALVHGLLRIKPVQPGWFLIFYLVLIVVASFFTEGLFALVTAAVLDSFINFRVRWSHASKFK